MTPDTPTSAAATDELDPAVAAVRRWRRELVEIGGPNTLLWRADDQTERLELTHAHPAGLAIFLSDRPTRLSDLYREPRTFAQVREVARDLRRAERRLWEENGLATCFLAAGMASWRMAGGHAPLAPIFLRPAELVPRDIAQSDFDLVVSSTTEVNPALVELLRAELGVELDAQALVEMSWGRTGFDPEPAYKRILDECGSLTGFTIERRLGVGIYPYAKLGMVADLADVTVAQHPLVRAMAGLPTTLRRPTPNPSPMPLVLPADVDQRGALAAIDAGDDVVVQGAPGTGMTQLVANAIAGLAAQGRSILLVSHKRAAIEAVRRRLHEVGLDLVTEAHDGPDLRHQHGPLTTVAVPAPITPTPETAADLRNAADTLHERLVALHHKREPWGVSAFQAQGAMVELAAIKPAPRSRVRVQGPALRRLTPEVLEDATRRLAQAARDGAWLTTDEVDSWRGARVLTPEDAEDALTACRRLVAADGLPRVLALASELCDEAGLPRPRTNDEIEEVLDLLAGVRATLDTFTEDVYHAPLPEMLEATSSVYRAEHGTSVSVLRRGQLKRDARRLVRHQPGPADLHGALLTAHDQVSRWRQRAGSIGTPVVPHGIDETREAHRAVAADLDRLEPVLATTAEGARLHDEPLDRVLIRLTRLVRQRERLAVLPKVARSLDVLAELGLTPLVDDLAARHVVPELVTSEIRHVWWSSVLDEIRRTDPRYGGHDGASLHAVADELRRLDARALRERAHAVGRATRGAHPCRAVSPYEVGAILKPGPVVDTVIVLEASQLAVAQAVSAISRGRQVVVCGDQQQLPPSELGFGTQDGQSEDVLVDQRAFSVLSVLAARLPVHTLRTHYRGVDDRLTVAIDDQLYVEEAAIVPSASTARRASVELVERRPETPRVRGQAPLSTPEEVDRVARLVLAHARGLADRSLGVVTLNPAHAAEIRARITAALVALGPGDPTLEFFAEDRPEPFFVKHVDDVQGDTRDDVILSVGFGTDESGRAGHRFGTLSLALGERRVAMAVTRARGTLTVVTTLGTEQLQQLSHGSTGVELLAEVVALVDATPDPAPSQGPLLDPVMVDLAARLRAAGLSVTERAGRGVGPIELAVRDPRLPDGIGVAVESDGTVYAHGREPLDRDVQRPALVERNGWVHLRVWTPDAFAAPEREAARIVQATRRRPARGLRR